MQEVRTQTTKNQLTPQVEVTEVVKQLHSDKALEMDEIVNESLMTSLFNISWMSGAFSKGIPDWGGGSPVQKEGPEVNYRSITLLSLPTLH